MRLPLIALALAVLVQLGCAAGFRAGGQQRGVGVGAAIRPPAPAQTVPPGSAAPFTPSSDVGGQRGSETPR